MGMASIPEWLFTYNTRGCFTTCSISNNLGRRTLEPVTTTLLTSMSAGALVSRHLRHPPEQLQHTSLTPHTPQHSPYAVLSSGGKWVSHEYHLMLVWCFTLMRTHWETDLDLREISGTGRSWHPLFPKTSSCALVTDHSYSPIQCAHSFGRLQ